MPKPQLYVTLKQKVRLTSEQLAFIAHEAERRQVSESQAIRDAIEHARTCPFFLSNGIANGQVSSVKGE
jgi:hypothetical protein